MKGNKVDQLVRFTFQKFGKSPRLATPIAIREARAAAQQILDAGWSQIQIMEMITFLLHDKADPVATGEWKNDISWWRSHVSDLPSLAKQLLKPDSKFATQFEAQAIHMHKWMEQNNYTMQDWIEDMLLPAKDSPEFSDAVFKKLVKNPDKFDEPKYPYGKEVKDELLAARDTVWETLAAFHAGNKTAALDYVKACRDADGKQLADLPEILASENPEDSAAAFLNVRLTRLENDLPEKHRHAVVTTADKEVQRQGDLVRAILRMKAKLTTT
jgi:hypothetical protein